MTDKIEKTEEQWKKELAPEVYEVTRKCGTEPAFTGKYYLTKDKGIYKCSNCGQELFSSDAKYDSGSGWPSFWAPMAGDKVTLVPDESFGMHRTEVKCSHCGAHLGHVFDDGPSDKTGQRFCINSLSLELDKKDE